MSDITVTMYIENDIDSEEQLLDITNILNECCFKLEDLKCNVFYRMRDSNNKLINRTPMNNL